MKVLVACEFSAIVRDAFRARGHDAWSCDLLPTEGDPTWHIQGDVRAILGDGWDLMIAHPPCTYLCSSGLHWNKRRPGRALETEKSLAFVQLLLDAPIPRIALENPVGCINTRIRKPDQVVQPYQFGDDASKTTCLWLKSLPPLAYCKSKVIQPRWVKGPSGKLLPRWGNQIDSGQNCLAPSKDDPDKRWMERSRTYSGIALAMAEQWSAVTHAEAPERTVHGPKFNPIVVEEEKRERVDIPTDGRIVWRM